ncbi:RICIN domain-containing protein [Glycomyces tenuis]
MTICLDVPSSSTASGTGLQQYDCWGGANQQWSR